MSIDKEINIFLYLKKVAKENILIVYSIHKIVKVENIEEIRSATAKIFTRLGIRDVDANVLAEILILDRETSVSELSKTLGYSISGVTSSLHRLMRMHLVHRNKIGKKYMYKSESNLLSALLHLMEDIQRHEIPVLMEKIKKKEKRGNEKIKELKEKVERANEYLTTLINILKEYGMRG